MHIHFKRFIRHKDSILRQFEELNNSDEETMTGKFIFNIMKKGEYESAYHVCTIEADKLRHTKYGDILRKYKIYIDFDKDKKRLKYERKCAFKNIGTYRERLRMDFLLGGI